MSRSPGSSRLLALDPGIGESGWAVFRNNRLVATGCVSQSRRQEPAAAARIDYLLETLDRVAERWQPQWLVCCQPSGIQWESPGLELLESRLAAWAERWRLRRRNYSAQEVRAAVTGSATAPPEQLAYTVMSALGRIGQRKSTHEWEAVAVGCYHLAQQHY